MQLPTSTFGLGNPSIHSWYAHVHQHLWIDHSQARTLEFPPLSKKRREKSETLKRNLANVYMLLSLWISAAAVQKRMQVKTDHKEFFVWTISLSQPHPNLDEALNSLLADWSEWNPNPTPSPCTHALVASNSDFPSPQKNAAAQNFPNPSWPQNRTRNPDAKHTHTHTHTHKTHVLKNISHYLSRS